MAQKLLKFWYTHNINHLFFSMTQTLLMYVSFVIQIILAGVLVNVWIFRFHKKTKYRGRGTKNMPEEFRAYGLPKWFMYLVGFFKISIAGFLVLGLWYPGIVPYALYLLMALMICAVAMHVKIGDTAKRSLPALGMLTLCVLALVFG